MKNKKARQDEVPSWRIRVENNIDDCLIHCTTADFLRVWAERDEAKREKYFKLKDELEKLENQITEAKKECLGCRHELELKKLKAAVVDLGKMFGLNSLKS